MADNKAYDGSTGTPPPYSQTWQEAPPPYTPYPVNQPQSQSQPQVVHVSRSVFHDGARFNQNSGPSIPPPPPGYQPNELQRMAMNGPVQVVFQNNRR